MYPGAPTNEKTTSKSPVHTPWAPHQRKNDQQEPCTHALGLPPTKKRPARTLYTRLGAPTNEKTTSKSPVHTPWGSHQRKNDQQEPCTHALGLPPTKKRPARALYTRLGAPTNEKTTSKNP